MNKINLSLLITFLLLTVSGAQVLADSLLYAEAKQSLMRQNGLIFVKQVTKMRKLTEKEIF